MHEFISVENIDESAMSAALRNLADLYRHTGYTNDIEVYKYAASERKFLITFRNAPDFEHFAYFVNYIRYPVDIDVPGIRVRGFYRMKAGDPVKQWSAGEMVQLYVSGNDAGCDNVCVVTANNESYLFDFGGNIKRLEFREEEYQLSGTEKAGYSLISTISPNTASSEPESAGGSSKPWWKFW